jgi:hypothetical protein
MTTLRYSKSFVMIFFSCEKSFASSHIVKLTKLNGSRYGFVRQSFFFRSNNQGNGSRDGFVCQSLPYSTSTEFNNLLT